MNLRAYVVGRRLCVIGVEDTSMGPIPLAAYVDLQEDVPQGIVTDDSPPILQRALAHAETRMDENFEEKQLIAAITSVVSRARDGDQNAMAILALMGKRAREGNPKALVVSRIVRRHISSTPSDTVEIGQEEAKPAIQSNPVLSAIVAHRDNGYAVALAIHLPKAPRTFATVMTLAHGPILSSGLIMETASHLDDEQDTLFLDGVKRCNDDRRLFMQAKQLEEDDACILLAGRLVGMARTVQAVGRAKMSEKAFGPDIAWELGF